MHAAQEIATSTAVPLNARSTIQERVEAGRISWTGPLFLAALRPLLFFSVQALLALAYFAFHRPDAWRQAGRWWNVYGTVVDIGCLIALRYFTRKEGIRLRDLIGPIRLRRGHDLFVGIGLFLLIFPCFIGGGILTQKLLYGSLDPAIATYVTQPHALPLWAFIYSVTLWWIISSPTEEIIYQGYALPRLQALTGRTWMAMIVVGFWWAAQHAVLPFVPDAKYLLFRLLAFLPGVFVFMLVYLRTRRLAPLIGAHWCMDIVGAVMTAIH
jgi:membrane protease YdiL (CAAX protease family)